MNYNVKANLAELRKFLTAQAKDDAAMPAADRRYQAEVVADVLDEEHLPPVVRKRLFKDYTGQVALLSHR